MPPAQVMIRVLASNRRNISHDERKPEVDDEEVERRLDAV